MPNTKKGVATARERASDLASDLADRIAPTYESARDKAAPLLADARDKAAPVLSDVRDKAAPVLSDARDKAAPVLDGARDRFTHDVLPMITAAAAAANEATEDVRGETAKRSRAAVAALRGEVEAPKETHRVRNLLVVLGLGGVAVAVAKMLSGRKPTTTWERPVAAPVAAPAPAAAAPDAGTDDGDDLGGSSPDVAAADAEATPHPATTPDDPAVVVDVSEENK